MNMMEIAAKRFYLCYLTFALFFLPTVLSQAQAQTVLLKGGNQSNLPTLAAREPAVTLDTLRLWIGTSGGNKDLTGSRWFYGAGAPSSVLGYISDIYLDTASGAVYQKTGAGWGSAIYTVPASNPGTVTSIALTVPTGFSVTGSPITSSGTLAISTSLTGLIKGTGSGFTAATAGTDYLAPVTGSANQTLRFSGTNTIASATNLTNNGTAVGVISASSDFGLVLTGSGSYGGLSLKAPARLMRFLNSANSARFDFGYDEGSDVFFISNAASIIYSSQRNGTVTVGQADGQPAPAGPVGLRIRGVSGQSQALATFGIGTATPLASIDTGGVAQFAGYKSSDGTPGGTATTGGLTFKNGLYASGTATSGGGAGFRISRAAGYQTLYAANTFYPDTGLMDADDATAYSKTGAGTTGSAVTALYDLRAVVDQTTLPVASVVARIGYKRTPAIAVEYSADGATWTTAPTMFSPTTALHGGTYAVEDYNLTLTTPISARFWRLSLQDAGTGSQATQASVARFLLFDADGNRVE